MAAARHQTARQSRGSSHKAQTDKYAAVNEHHRAYARFVVVAVFACHLRAPRRLRSRL